MWKLHPKHFSRHFPNLSQDSFQDFPEDSFQYSLKTLPQSQRLIQKHFSIIFTWLFRRLFANLSPSLSQYSFQDFPQDFIETVYKTPLKKFPRALCKTGSEPASRHFPGLFQRLFRRLPKSVSKTLPKTLPKTLSRTLPKLIVGPSPRLFKILPKTVFKTACNTIS